LARSASSYLDLSRAISALLGEDLDGEADMDLLLAEAFNGDELLDGEEALGGLAGLGGGDPGKAGLRKSASSLSVTEASPSASILLTIAVSSTSEA
jgi:hypothetical protein